MYSFKKQTKNKSSIWSNNVVEKLKIKINCCYTLMLITALLNRVNMESMKLSGDRCIIKKISHTNMHRGIHKNTHTHTIFVKHKKKMRYCDLCQSGLRWGKKNHVRWNKPYSERQISKTYLRNKRQKVSGLSWGDTGKRIEEERWRKVK